MLSMRRSFRFFSSCSTSSLITGLLPVHVEQKVVARDAAQDHPFEPVQVVQTVLAGFPDGRQKRLARILLDQSQQLAQGNTDHLAAPLLQSRHVLGDLRRGLDRSEE